jgi:hypothetical protein
MKRSFRLLVTSTILALGLLGLLLLASSTAASPGQLQSPLLPSRSGADDPARVRADSWTSGWLDITPNQVLTLTHDLGGNADEYAVDLWYRDTDPGGLGINHRAYGGMEAVGQVYGLAWQRLTATTVQVYREGNDIYGDQILVRVWKPEPAVYDSGWLDITPGQMLTLTHGVGGNVDDYTVGIEFRDTRPNGLGVHQRYVGGFEIDGQWLGAAWDRLSDTIIRVFRFGDDVAVGQVRVMIFRPDPPDYDSGWRNIAAGQALTLTHNLAGNPMGYVVRASARDTRPGGRGINSLYTGGLEANGRFYGSNWEQLTAATIRLFRQPDDGAAHTTDQARVRIWAAKRELYLPLISVRSGAAAKVGR